MVRLDKIYTRGGDKGKTSLGDGKRVKKNNLRVDVYGEIDEANSTLGVAIAYCSPKMKKILQKIQNDLFDLGADLCYPDSSKKKSLKISKQYIDDLENSIDEVNKTLDPLKSFILPGGQKSSAYIHYCRCVVRRAERKLVTLAEKEHIDKMVFQYLNRLSDFLFVVARFENKKKGDILWKPGKEKLICDKE